MHYLGRHTPLATATRWRILQAGSASATCVTSCAIQITHTDRARTLLNHSHMPGVVLSQITARARGKKQEAAHHLLLKVPGPRVGGGVLICNLVSFGGKLNDILDPVILGEKSERKIIRTVHCKPKESSLRQGLIFQHLIWFLKFKKKKKKGTYISEDMANLVSNYYWIQASSVSLFVKRRRKDLCWRLVVGVSGNNACERIKPDACNQTYSMKINPLSSWDNKEDLKLVLPGASEASKVSLPNCRILRQQEMGLHAGGLLTPVPLWLSQIKMQRRKNMRIAKLLPF